MNNRTPWAQSSVLSERVKPKKSPASAPRNKGKGKEASEQQLPKSSAVRALEITISKLNSEPGNQLDPKGGCFCLARTHELCPYCPLCLRCGLILCIVNSPYYACPDCSQPLLSPPGKHALIERLRIELSSTIAKEEEEAERAREEAREIAGAFPQLRDAVQDKIQAQQMQTQTHKVLSLNSKTKRVTVASYSAAPMPLPVSLKGSDVRGKDEELERVPAPPLETEFAQGLVDAGRPWLDIREDGFACRLTYVRDPRIDRQELKEERKARKAKKKKGGDDGGDEELLVS